MTWAESILASSVIVLAAWGLRIWANRKIARMRQLRKEIYRLEQLYKK